MKPKAQPSQGQNYLFDAMTLEEMCNGRHPLIQLAKRIDWARFDREYEPLYCDSNGCPARPTRLMAALQYLKYTFNLSDEETVSRWTENPYWQYFSGEIFFQKEAPIDPSSMTRWRKRIGEEGLKTLFEETIQVARKGKAITPQEMSHVIVDTTVEEKNITFPTGAKLLYHAIVKSVKLSKRNGIRLRQTYTRKAKFAMIMSGRYANAQQWKRQKREIRDLKNWLGRILREMDRSYRPFTEDLALFLNDCRRIHAQEKNTKNKIYSLHEPKTECIGKGKARIRYEFGQKVSIVTSNRGNWILNVQLCPGNPYDGHTLSSSIAGAESHTQVAVTEISVDKGYRGHDYKGSAVVRISGSRNTSLTRSEKRRKRRRSAIEPIIGHLKSDHRLGRCFLKGLVGDSVNLILSAAGKNLRKLLNLIARRELSPFFSLLERLRRWIFALRPPQNAPVTAGFYR